MTIAVAIECTPPVSSWLSPPRWAPQTTRKIRINARSAIRKATWDFLFMRPPPYRWLSDGWAAEGTAGPCVRPALPAEVVRDAHGARRVAGHGVDAAVRGAGADRHDRQGLGGQAVDPLARGHRLAGLEVVAEPAPVPFLLDGLVRDGALDDQHEGVDLAPLTLVEPLDEGVGPLLGSTLEVD